MSGYTIDEARRIAINCASSYKSSLENKQFIIVYRDRDTNKIEYIEVVFLARNYQHLTGLNMIDDSGNIMDHRSEFFYKKCIEKKLSNNEIAMRPDGTTQLKLEALPAITKFTAITKIVGDSNNNQPYLYVEKVVGGVNLCLGLRLDEELQEYVPVSALKKDIKTLTNKPSQVLAIFERDFGSTEVYSKIRHVAKGLNLGKISFPKDIDDKISLENYLPK